jgi:hypothetical protein
MYRLRPSAARSSKKLRDELIESSESLLFLPPPYEESSSNLLCEYDPFPAGALEPRILLQSPPAGVSDTDPEVNMDLSCPTDTRGSSSGGC